MDTSMEWDSHSNSHGNRNSFGATNWNGNNIIRMGMAHI